MTRLRRAWAWVSGDQGPLYDEQRRAGEARIAHHLAMAAQADAAAEQERTIQALRSVSRYMRLGRDRAWDERDRARATAVALEADCALLTHLLVHEAGEFSRTSSALNRACVGLELERANAVAMTRVLSHTMEYESRRAACPECHAVEATVAAAQVPS